MKLTLTTDQVRITYGDYGNDVEKIELLLLPDTVFITEYDGETISISATDSDDETILSGTLSYETLDCFIKQLIKIRKQAAQGTTSV